jgi:hypothetical protein
LDSRSKFKHRKIYLAGCGTQTADYVLVVTTPVFSASSATEEYNGSTWTSVNLNTARWELAGAGIQTAALAFGGYTGTANTTATEEYDGTSWATSPGSLSTARDGLGGAGTQTSALAFGGYPGTT